MSTEAPKILLATDPEFFLKDGKGKTVSAAGLFGYGKDKKLDTGKGVRIQEDNVLLEFDTDPHSAFKDFDGNILLAFELSEKLANEHNLSLDLSKCSHIFSADELSKFPKSAMEFGCDPDYNALTGDVNPKPKAADAGLRTAGGHIHIGYDHLGTMTEDNKKILGVMCDYMLGLESLLLDSDDCRRELYGKAGACRFKEYGIEYRTLSNFWLANEDLRKWAFDNVHKAYLLATTDRFQDAVATISPEEIQRVINENDKRMAESYVRRLEGVAA